MSLGIPFDSLFWLCAWVGFVAALCGLGCVGEMVIDWWRER